MGKKMTVALLSYSFLFAGLIFLIITQYYPFPILFTQPVLEYTKDNCTVTKVNSCRFKSCCQSRIDFRRVCCSVFVNIGMSIEEVNFVPECCHKSNDSTFDYANCKGFVPGKVFECYVPKGFYSSSWVTGPKNRYTTVNYVLDTLSSVLFFTLFTLSIGCIFIAILYSVWFCLCIKLSGSEYNSLQ